MSPRTYLLGAIGALVIASINAPLVVAGQAGVHLVIVPVEQGPGIPRSLGAGLPRRVRELLRQRDVNVWADVVDSATLARAGGGAAGGPIPPAVLQALARSDTAIADRRLLRISLSLTTGRILHADVAVLAGDLVPRLEFAVEDPETAADPLAGAIVDALEMRLARNIRIAVLPLEMIGGPSSYVVFARSLPSMLSTELKVSPRFVLVEPPGPAFERDLAALKVPPGRTDPRTAMAIGSLYNANYYITGEYWEWKGGIRLDIRCVNASSAEIIASSGFGIDSVALSIASLQQRIRELAANFRSVIGEDFAVRAHRDRYIAVAAFPPVPDTYENRAVLLEAVRATTRKLKVGTGAGWRVRDAVDSLPPIVSARSDRWLLSSEMQADLLLSLRLDRMDRDRVVFDYELFDQDHPRLIETFSDTTTFTAIDSLLDRIALRVLDHTGGAAPASIRRFGEFPYRGVHEPLRFALTSGVAVRESPSLYLGVSAGITLEMGVTVMPWRSERLQFDVANLRIDAYGSRSDGRKVFGADVETGVLFKLRPNHALNPFVGGTLAGLGVVRRSEGGELNFDARPGLGLVGGIEQTLGRGRQVLYRIRFTRATMAIREKTLGGQNFRGGRPGGLYLGIGLLFSM